MNITKTKKWREQTKYDKMYQDSIIYCKCGHSLFLPKQNPVKICSHCKKYVFRDEKEKFKFMLNKRGVDEG